MITANPIISPENSVASVYQIGEELRQSLRRQPAKLRYLEDAIQDIAIRAWLEPERLTTSGQIAKALKNRIVDLQRADIKQQIHAENRGERPAEKEPIVSVLIGELRERCPIHAGLADGYTQRELADQIGVDRGYRVPAMMADEKRRA